MPKCQRLMKREKENTICNQIRVCLLNFFRSMKDLPGELLHNFTRYFSSSFGYSPKKRYGSQEELLWSN